MVVHEPVLFFATKDPLGAGHMGRPFALYLSDFWELSIFAGHRALQSQ